MFTLEWKEIKKFGLWMFYVAAGATAIWMCLSLGILIGAFIMEWF